MKIESSRQVFIEQTNERTDEHLHLLSSCRSQKGSAKVLRPLTFDFVLELDDYNYNYFLPPTGALEEATLSVRPSILHFSQIMSSRSKSLLEDELQGGPQEGVKERAQERAQGRAQGR